MCDVGIIFGDIYVYIHLYFFYLVIYPKIPAIECHSVASTSNSVVQSPASD